MHTNFAINKDPKENAWRGQHKHFKKSVSSTSSLCVEFPSTTKRPLKDYVFHLVISQPVGLKAAEFKISMERYALK